MATIIDALGFPCAGTLKSFNSDQEFTPFKAEQGFVKKFIAVLLIALIPAQLLAWGPKGHAIIADIAAS
ncbi:MAG: hypothetical protein WA672_19540, partial [Candidatus Angelobacter sp.]